MNYFSFLKKKNKEIQFEQYPTSAHIGNILGYHHKYQYI